MEINFMAYHLPSIHCKLLVMHFMFCFVFAPTFLGLLMASVMPLSHTAFSSFSLSFCPPLVPMIHELGYSNQVERCICPQFINSIESQNHNRKIWCIGIYPTWKDACHRIS